MYALWDLMEYACSSSQMYFTYCDKYKPKDSVWRIPFKNTLSVFFEEMHELGQSSDLYIAIFWLTIFFAIIGILTSLYEMMQIFKSDDYEPRTFGSRTYDYVNLRFRRSARVFGTTLNIKLYITLIYGMLSNRASYISPWVYVYTFVIPIEIFHWTCDVFFKEIYDDIRAYRLMYLTIRWGLTIHILATVRNFQEQE